MFVKPTLWVALEQEPRWEVVTPDPRHPQMLEFRTFTGLLVHAWTRPTTIEDFTPRAELADEAFAAAEDVLGWHCQPLRQLRQWKMEAGRDKDYADAATITTYLRKQRTRGAM
jgi:hypothetical protein